MKTYRLYFLRDDGHIAAVLEIEGDSDAEAIAVAAAHPDRRAKELWLLDRRIQVLPVSPAPPQP